MYLRSIITGQPLAPSPAQDETQAPGTAKSGALAEASSNPKTKTADAHTAHKRVPSPSASSSPSPPSSPSLLSKSPAVPARSRGGAIVSSPHGSPDKMEESRTADKAGVPRTKVAAPPRPKTPPAVRDKTIFGPCTRVYVCAVYVCAYACVYVCVYTYV